MWLDDEITDADRKLLADSAVTSADDLIDIDPGIGWTQSVIDRTVAFAKEPDGII